MQCMIFYGKRIIEGEKIAVKCSIQDKVHTFFSIFQPPTFSISESSPSLHAFLPSFPSFSFLPLSLPPSLSFFCSSLAPSWSDLVLHLAITHYVLQNYLELLISHLLLAGLSVRSLHSQLNVSNFIAYKWGWMPLHFLATISWAYTVWSFLRSCKCNSEESERLLHIYITSVSL